ncbi:MAG: glycosyltransferase [Burkholderiales bacterium]|nr:glycosyltransferase [Opitutaceae bacterium]
MSVPFSACLPCFNNLATLRSAVASVLRQTIPPAEVVVIDDGSTDGVGASLADLDVRVVRHAHNLGRGAARARALAEVRHELVLCCDATISLAATFVAGALPWFEHPGVAAVYGRIAQPAPRGVAERWRGRHLFKIAQQPTEVRHHAALFTGGTMLRKSSVAQAGGFNVALRHSEDADLGRRLRERGCDIVRDPALEMVVIGHNTVPQVLERYWRWNAGADEAVTWRGYRANVGYAVSMAAMDWRARDLLSCGLSLVCPHYCFWRSRWRSAKRR